MPFYPARTKTKEISVPFLLLQPTAIDFFIKLAPKPRRLA